MNSKFSFLRLMAVAVVAITGCTPGAVIPSPAPEATNSAASPQAATSTPIASASPSSPSSAPANSTPPTTGTTSTQAPTQSTPAPDGGKPVAKSAARKVKSCVVKMAVVNDPESPLNVRSAPTTEGSKILGQIPNGTYLSVEKEQAGWFQIAQPQQGWVAKNRTKHGCSEKVERVSFGKGEPAIQIGDRFIGTGYHQYQFSGTKGQTMTITQQEGPFPMVIGPNGTPMVPGPDDQRTQWSGPLPETGDYTVQFDSNFKGYAYAVKVEIK